MRGAAPGQRGSCGRLHALAHRLPYDAAGTGAPGAYGVLMGNTQFEHAFPWLVTVFKITKEHLWPDTCLSHLRRHAR